MKTVGILSFYVSHNHGTVLQCYALKKAIEKTGDYKVGFIPYTFYHLEKSLNGFSGKELREKYDVRIEKFDKFKKERLECNEADIPELTKENMPKYDTYVVGSDTVWKLEFINYDETYFLPEIPLNSRKISYAASAGDRFTTDYEKYLSKHLKSFDAVSVREKHFADYINSVVDVDAKHVLDPTLLHDMSVYRELEEAVDLPSEPYILVYWLNTNDASTTYIHELTNRMAKKFNMKVLHFIYNAPDYLYGSDGESFSFAGVGEFLTYMANASYIFTNSYHGTCLSLVYKKKFWSYSKNGMKSRVGSLLEELGLQNRLFTPSLNLAVYSDNIEYDAVYDKIEAWRSYSYRFLKDNL